jgi:hypothetical protein
MSLSSEIPQALSNQLTQRFAIGGIALNILETHTFI